MISMTFSNCYGLTSDRRRCRRESQGRLCRELVVERGAHPEVKDLSQLMETLRVLDLVGEVWWRDWRGNSTATVSSQAPRTCWDVTTVLSGTTPPVSTSQKRVSRPSSSSPPGGVRSVRPEQTIRSTTIGSCSSRYLKEGSSAR